MKKILSEKQIEIDGIAMILRRKRIRNLHLRISPPLGEVKVSAPAWASLGEIKKFITQRIEWIREKQIEVRNRKIIAPPKFISGESHYFCGEKFELRVVENSRSNKVVINGDILELHCKKSESVMQRKKILDDFYRQDLAKKIPPLIEKYEEKMALKVKEVRIKKMTTRWGTCNVRARRIWFSLELAKKSFGVLELIVVHEMTHFFEHRHNKKFYALMEKFFPEWQRWEGELKDRKVID